MNKRAEQGNARKLDQFYTDPQYASEFLEKIKTLVAWQEFDCQLEPSAGAGAFYSLLDPHLRIGLDLEPQCSGVLTQDFLQWTPPLHCKNIITLGNPPFGKNSSLAVHFFNRAARFSKVIAFILPRTFRKASVENRLDSQFHLVWDATVPDSSFVYLGKSYSVPTTAQVWVKRSQPRARRSVLKLTQFDTWFELVEPQHSDFAIQRVGVRAGRIRIQDRLEFSPESHWFIRAHDPRVLGVFQSCDWDSVKWNTAGNPSISPGELAELWIQASARQGINITQKSSSELFEW